MSGQTRYPAVFLFWYPAAGYRDLSFFKNNIWLVNTLESLKSSVRGGISSRNANVSPNKILTNEERASKFRSNRPLYMNMRANSEPP